MEISDKNGILANDTSKQINSSDKSVNLTFPSSLLSVPKFNYSIKIHNNNNDLIYRKLNIESQSYTNYETGTNVTRITDASISNNLIRMNITVNSSQTITTNITLALAYNSSKISKRIVKQLEHSYIL